MKTITKKVEQITTMYIADDGREFIDEYACEEYEERLKREAEYKRYKSVLDNMEQIGYDMAAIGMDYVCYDSWNYLWYKPKNQEEIDAINYIYDGVDFSDDQINTWCGIETNDVDNYSMPTLEEQMETTRKFWNAFGYDVVITERR